MCHGDPTWYSLLQVLMKSNSNRSQATATSTTVTEAWYQFITDGRPATGKVRPDIAESWQRSVESGVQPRGQCAPLVTAQSLEQRRQQNSELLNASEHTWRLLSDSLMASDNVFVVADAAGVILDVRGNSEFVAAAARQYCGPGRNWDESVSGTNAIGTALIRKQPTIVHSNEHFVEAAKAWDCAAAPIHDLADGSLIGILDITSVGDLSDHHSLALAVTAAHQIEHALHSQALAHSVQLLNWYRNAVIPWQHHDALLLDGKGRVIRATASVQSAIDTNAMTFPIIESRPQPGINSEIKIIEVQPYRPPADTLNPDNANKWHGGLVRISAQQVAPKQPAITASNPAFQRISTADPGMLAVIHQAERMAKASSPILLEGETGTGKELFANAIHASSELDSGPFVAVNCGTLTKELAASELLGYEAGAFTGAAVNGRQGKFEQADGGTLFLDEIGELPADVQVHLLRVLQDNVVVRLGGNTERTVRVRIIAASLRDLQHEVDQHHFRADLLFRLRVLALKLPPLRERPGDIELLIQQQLQQLQARYGLGTKIVSDDLMAILQQHVWPGNVHELHGLIESLYILSDRRILTQADLPESFQLGQEPQRVNASFVPASGRLEQLEHQAIAEEIARQQHNMSAVARSLGISRSTLYRRVKQLGIKT